MEKTTLYLPTELQSSLRDLSRRSGRPQAALIREAVAEYVTRQQKPWPKSIGSGADGRVTGRASEDWLREQWSRPDATPKRHWSRR
jgi:predicted transcriptional regulator